MKIQVKHIPSHFIVVEWLVYRDTGQRVIGTWEEV